MRFGRLLAYNIEGTAEPWVAVLVTVPEPVVLAWLPDVV